MGLGLFRRARRKKKSGKTKEKRELVANFEKMVKKFGGTPGEKVDRTFKPLKDPLQNVLQFNSDRLVTDKPSTEYQPAGKPKEQKRYTGKMAEREAKAQKEIEAKKKRVAIPYNKGGYQYIEGYDPKDLGKKT